MWGGRWDNACAVIMLYCSIVCYGITYNSILYVMLCYVIMCYIYIYIERERDRERESERDVLLRDGVEHRHRQDLWVLADPVQHRPGHGSS